MVERAIPELKDSGRDDQATTCCRLRVNAESATSSFTVTFLIMSVTTILSTTAMPVVDLADDRVLAVEPRARGLHDVDLAVGAARIAAVREADGAAHVRRFFESSKTPIGVPLLPVPQ